MFDKTAHNRGPRMASAAYAKHQAGVKAKQRAFKAMLVLKFGGACELCGYARNYAALDFDHKDPSIKEDTVGRLINNQKWEAALLEAQKCRLLCSNCHREATWPVGPN